MYNKGPLSFCVQKENENVYEAKEGTKFPVKWTAPEAIHENRFSIKSDVWSFGVLLYEIMTFGQMPYPSEKTVKMVRTFHLKSSLPACNDPLAVPLPAMTNYQVVQKIPLGYRMSCPPSCHRIIYDIMLECWKENELERPTFETLQWKLEDFFDQDMTSYDDASRY